MDFETFDRIDGLTLTKDAIALRDVLTRMSVNLFNEGFDKEDIIEFFQKVVELEIDSIPELEN
jgi:hypothetical protein